MNKRCIAVLTCALALGSIGAFATPSTTYWTPMTPDVQAYGVPHLGVDNYFTVARDAEDGGGSFPTDLGLTIGVLPFKAVVAEVGVDLLEPSDDPLYFNAKIGIPEDTLFSGAPTLQAGIFNVGTRKNVTDQNIVYGVVGKTIPGIGRLSAGPYIGNRDVLVDADGHEDNTGFMAAFDRGFLPAKDKDDNEYNRWVFAADYASGKNALGGGGFGIYRFFTKDISLLTGPVWFNEKAINGEWKWTVQLDINF
ncbi:MAG: hypothetical protein HY343_11455 [Lentisphaerae bacterium]|nr:hypothetical protein [Lentisphaerota bacterium]